MTKNKTRLILAISILSFLSTALSGCGGLESWLERTIGLYQGLLVTQVPDGAEGQYLARARVIKEGEHGYLLRVMTLSRSQTRYWRFSITVENNERVRVSTRRINGGGEARITLHKINDECFGSQQEDARMCFAGGELYFELPARTSGERFMLLAEPATGRAVAPPMETPRTFSMAEITDRTINHGFDSRIEFERVVQARLNAEHAMLSLLPRITANTVLSFIVFGALGPLAIIGDIAPFLFPTRWTQARQQAILADAEFAGMILMRADAAHIAEGLALTVQRDNRVIEIVERTRRMARELRPRMEVLQQMGIIDGLGFDAYLGTVNTMERAVSDARFMRRGNLSALAQAMGFFNPEAVSSVTAASLTMEGAEAPASRDVIVEAVLRRSYELRQADALIEAGDWSEAERYFGWLDPMGNPAGALGFSLPSYIMLGQSQSRELRIRRERTQADLIRKTYEVIDIINRSLQTRQYAVQAAELMERRVANLNFALDIGSDVTPDEIAQAMYDLARTHIEIIDAEFAYHIAQAKLNRLLYAGPYSGMNPERGRLSVERSVGFRAH